MACSSEPETIALIYVELYRIKTLNYLDEICISWKTIFTFSEDSSLYDNELSSVASCLRYYLRDYLGI